MNYFISYKIKDIKSVSAFLKNIDYPNTNNLALIKKGTQSFGISHIKAARKVYNADINFFFDKKHTEMFTNKKPVSAYVNLLEAVHRIGLEILH